MELCRCEDYKAAVENLKVFFPGAIHYLEEQKPDPENYCVKWIKNKVSPESPQFMIPILVQKQPQTPKEDEEVKEKPEIESKWIPVLPGLISQKIVNEEQKLKTIFF